jgi:hypothetical protein
VLYLVNIMNIRVAIAAGSIGRVVMTLLFYGAPIAGMPQMDIVGMLGTMFTTNKESSVQLGGIIHLVIGSIFAFIYVALWSVGIGSPTWWWGLLFGTVHGVLAILALPLLIQIHPHPPKITRGPLVVGELLAGHMIYGVVVALVYAGRW